MFVSFCVVTYQAQTPPYQYLVQYELYEVCNEEEHVTSFLNRLLQVVILSWDTSLQYVNINFYADYSNLEQTSLFIWYDNNKDTSNEVTKHVIRIYEKLICDSMHYNSTRARICNTKDEKDAMTMSLISLILKSVMKNNIILHLNWASEIYMCGFYISVH